MFNNNKVVIVLRSTSGSGKSTFANYIKFLVDNNAWVEICSADDFFINKETGEYNFNANKLGAAHNYCRQKFIDFLEKEVSCVIVDNTGTSYKEIEYYLDKAKEYGYSVFSLVIENRNDTKNVHSVPDLTLEKQEKRLRESIKLR